VQLEGTQGAHTAMTAADKLLLHRLV
jgi:hypothetical protein